MYRRLKMVKMIFPIQVTTTMKYSPVSCLQDPSGKVNLQPQTSKYVDLSILFFFQLK